MKQRKWLFSLSILLAFIMLIIPFPAKASSHSVYVIPIDETVESGMYEFLKGAVKEAQENEAKAIIFHMHTPGGELQAAINIGKLISNTTIPTYVLVDNMAISAGAYIALNTDEIYMTPGSTMGAATAITQDGNAADGKTQSFWLEAMVQAAIASGKDPIYAQAMVDPAVEIPTINLDSKHLLTLGTTSALEVGYSNGTVANLDTLLTHLGLENENIVHKEQGFWVKLARLVTNPYIVPILLSIGSIGLVLELYSPGFGLPGLAGISSLLLFFYGHLIVGLAGYESIILFVIGIILIVLEIYLPGGILGLLGVGSIVTSLLLAGGSFVQMGYSIVIAFLLTCLVIILMTKVIGKNMKFLKKIILSEATTSEQGYVSNEDRVDLIGKTGITLTQMRPAGVALINGERLDVVSVGDFIEKDVKVKVVQVEGSRIVISVLTE